MKKISLVCLIILIINLVIVGCSTNSKSKDSSTLNSEILIKQPSENKQSEIPLLHQRYTMAPGKNGEEDCTYSFYIADNGDLWRWIEGTKDRKIIDTGVQAIMCSGNGEFIAKLKYDGCLLVTFNEPLGSDYYHKGYLLSDLAGTSEHIMQNVKMASVGRNHVIMLKQDNTVWLCGENGDGQLGNGQPDNGKRSDDLFNYKPEQVLSDCVFISAGNSHSAAITSNYDLYLWGDNSCGEIGNGERGNGFPTASNLVVSRPYLALKNVKWVRLLGTTTFAITTDNALWAWGSNQSTVPTKVAEDVLDVTGDGDNATYILDAGGKVFRLEDMFNLLFENVSSFDSSFMTLFTLQKYDGIFEVYSYESDAGRVADNPHLVKKIAETDFY